MRYNVPLVQAVKASDCWHACVQMLYKYRNKSFDPMPDAFRRDQGLNGSDVTVFLQLAAHAGLSVPEEVSPGVTTTFTIAAIDQMLTRYQGPLFCGMRWSTGVGHCIVVTGVDNNGTLYENDPNPTKGREVRTVAWFNEKIAKDCHAPILYLPS